MTIGNNIAKLAQSSNTMDIATKNGAKSIELINKETGDLNSTYKVLEQISDSWDDMSDAQRTNLAITLAGKNQFAVFNSVVSNFADAQKSLTLALNSSGSAEEENSKYLDSLQGKTAQLQQQLEKLVLGNGGFNSLLKMLVTLGTELLKFANNTDALVISLSVIGSLLAIKVIPSLISFVKTIGVAITGLKAFSLTAMSIPNVLGLAVTLLGITTLAYNAFAKSQDEATKSVSELNDELTDSNSAVKETQSKIENITSQIDKIDEKIDNLSKMEIVDDSQLTKLETEKTILENQLEVQKAQLKIDQERQKIKANEALTTSVQVGSHTERKTSLGAFGELTGFGAREEVVADYSTPLEQLKNIQFIYLKQPIRCNKQSKKEKLEEQGEDESDRYKQLNKEIES
jgi:hypothetical protein